MKLIHDTETFQKERPLTITNTQRTEILKNVAKSILEYSLSKDDIEIIIEDLDEVYNSSSTGFEMAKELEDGWASGDYTINSTLIELLESLDHLSLEKQRNNLKDWVKAHDIKPKLKQGQKIKLNQNLAFSFISGDEIYINRIKTDTAHYVVHKDPKYRGGIVVEYEKLEETL